MNIDRVSFKNGNYIFILGDEPDYFYIVKEGKVKMIFQTTPNIFYGEGEFFGEFSILTNSKRAGSALALTNVTLERIHKSDFYDFLKLFPNVLYKIINKYCSYIEAINTYFGGQVLNNSSNESVPLQDNSNHSFKEGLELFFDGKYEESIVIMERVIENNDEEKWQAKSYLALSYSKIGRDIKLCKSILEDVIRNAPTPAEKDLAQSIMNRIR